MSMLRGIENEVNGGRMGSGAGHSNPRSRIGVGALLLVFLLTTGARLPRVDPDFVFDVVFEGTVLTAEKVFRPRHDDFCQWGPGKSSLVDYSVRVDRLIHGVMSSDTMQVTRIQVTRHELDHTGPGKRVLVYGHYNCTDGGRIWAGMAPRSLRVWVPGSPADDFRIFLPVAGRDSGLFRHA